MLNSNELMRIIKRCTQPLSNRIAMLIGRCVLLATNDAQGIQKINSQVLAGEILEDIERFQNYGMTSNPPSNSEGVILFPLGNREHGICVSVDNRQFRLKSLAQGEVAIYTDEGDKIHFKRGNIIEVATETANITATNVNLTGDLSVTGNIVATGNVSDATSSMQDMRDTYNTHTHNENNVPGGPTNAPNESM